mgnify:CR=1 FL=1
MVRLKLWQWAALGLPLVAVLGFLLISAGVQIHEWRLNWIWAVITLMFVVWRSLLVKWTRPALDQMEAIVAEVTEEMEANASAVLKEATSDTKPGARSETEQIERLIQQVVDKARLDPSPWEDWGIFWQRCQELVVAIAQIYHPEVKHPYFNIYIPQAYALIRNTVDDVDQWMQKLSPALNQVTIAQAIQAYEVYRKLEPSARKLWQVWNWAQWFLNPAAAIAKRATQRHTDQANQQLLVNLSQLLKEAALRNLANQAIALYSGQLANLEPAPLVPLPETKTQTLRDILTQAESPAAIEQKPVNILLVGRTGAGKSSLINTLFIEDKAAVDVLPSTDQIQDYHWRTKTGESLTLWDTPGYEQSDRPELREQVLAHASEADLLLLVTPALDPALQMDLDFLRDVQAEAADLPAIVVVTKVDQLRPLREWNPPYDWEWGGRPKEVAIREATQYRSKQFGDLCKLVLPVVTGNSTIQRADWGIDALSLGLITAIAPAKQYRLARFLRNLEARTVAAAKIIDHYTFQMTTTQGLAALLKSPILTFLSTLTTGTPALAYVLAEKIPVEQMPVVIGKLQMAYELFNLLSAGEKNGKNFDLLSLWPLLLDCSAAPNQNAWAFGHAIAEYWTQDLTAVQLSDQFKAYLQKT